MINPEKLLSTVLSEVMGSKRSRKKGNSLFSSLSSGTTLMTAIGLGIGAYEVFTQSRQTETASGKPPAPGAAPPPPPPSPGRSAMPPPLPIASDQGASIAILMLRTMIAAAHADGMLDKDEEQAILARVQQSDLAKEDKMFFLDELTHPKTLTDLFQEQPDPAAARAIYLAAVSTITVDTPQERQWLDQLAAGLGLSQAVQQFIERQNEE